MGRLILPLSALIVLWAAGMPPQWIAFLLVGCLLMFLMWWAIVSRRRGRVVGRTYHMRIDGDPFEDNEGVDRPPVVNSTVTGVMVEEYASGELRAFTIDRKIVLVTSDPMLVEVLPCGNVLQTGPYVGRARVSIKARSPRYAPLPPDGPIIADLFVRIVPGPPCKVTIKMVGPPRPTQ